MRRLMGSLLVCTLALAGVRLAPSAAAADAETTTSMAQAERGTVAQLESVPPPPSIARADTGTGRRVVYGKFFQHVWLFDDAGNVIRDYAVSGRWDQPDPGTYFVYSKSLFTCNVIHADVCMRYMVRFATGPLGGNIGFHEIPVRNGKPLQPDSLLGTPQSDGCVRQATADAQFMWDFAQVGTKVVVVP